MDINAEISYKWNYGWRKTNEYEWMDDGKRPIVNPLLAAIIEEDVVKMNCLFDKGASVRAMNKPTLERVLFVKIANYKVIECLICHGLGTWILDSCRERDGRPWGLPAKAYYSGAMKSFELLIQNGFNDFSYAINNRIKLIEGLIFSKGDVAAMKLLLENGYDRYSNPIDRCMETYPNSKVAEYLRSYPVIHRKTAALDSDKYQKTIAEPKLLSVPILFHRKEIQELNKKIREDYEDRKRVIAIYQKNMTSDEKKWVENSKW